MTPPTTTSPSASSDDREALAGLVERVTFHNPENGFWVLRVKVRGQRDLVTVVGYAATISATGRLSSVTTMAHVRPTPSAVVIDRLGIRHLENPDAEANGRYERPVS